MLVDGQRVEVKSSLARQLPSGRHFYQFQNIKTKNFDKIVLVYITPNGIKTKTLTKKTMMKKLRRNKYYSNGKTLAGAA
jgi:hypothetical protein